MAPTRAGAWVLNAGLTWPDALVIASADLSGMLKRLKFIED